MCILQFNVELLERAAAAFSGIVDANAQELCSYSIQMVLRELIGRNGAAGEALWNALSERCHKEVHMLRSSNFTRKGPPKQLPTQRSVLIFCLFVCLFDCLFTAALFISMFVYLFASLFIY